MKRRYLELKMNDGCKNLEARLDMDIHLLNEHSKAHAWLNHIPDEEKSKLDLINKGYLDFASEVYCIHACPIRKECETYYNRLEGYNGKKQRI